MRHARRWGCRPDRRLALVALGAGNINDMGQQAGAVAAALRRLGVEICVTQPEIAASDRSLAGVHVVREFRFLVRFRAFDLAVSAAGYNSFHELLRFGIPTLFIPNQDTALDDQQGGARFASDQGLAHMLGQVSVEATTVLVDDLLNRGQAMVAKVPAVDRGNGAAAAACPSAHACRGRRWSWLRTRCKQRRGWRAGCRGIDGSGGARSRGSDAVLRRERWPTACSPVRSSGGSGPPADVAAGRLLAGLGVEQLPVILFSLIGLTDGTAENAAVEQGGRCCDR